MTGRNRTVLAAAALAAASIVASTLAASAQDYDGGTVPARRTLHRRPVEAYRPLTVGRTRAEDDLGPVVVAPVYNPYAGPAAVVTGPIAFGATLASLPFRAVNSVFPAQGNTPLVVVGAPVHFAGRVVQAPFAIAEAPFGGPGPFVDPGF